MEEFNIEAYKKDLESMTNNELKAEADYLIRYILAPMPEWEERWAAVWAELDVRLHGIS